MLFSCKKIDKINNTEASIIQKFKENNSDIGITKFIPINKKFFYSYYTDKDGVERVAGSTDETLKRDFTLCSDASCPNPLTQDYQTETQLNLMGRMYSCTRGVSDISFNWDVSVPNTLVLNNPSNLSQSSVGKIWMRTSGNVNIITGLALVPTITYVGVDPNCGFHNIFNIQYTLKGIPQNFFSANPGYKILTQFVIFNECQDYMDTYISPTYTYITTTTYGDVDMDQYGNILGPCQRTDRCYTSSASPYATVVGGYSLCTFTPAYPTEYHRYEYRGKDNVSSNLWSAQTSTVQWAQNLTTNVPTHDLSPYGALKMPDMISGSGTWIVRYQNYMSSSPCSPSSPWIEEVYTY